MPSIFSALVGQGATVEVTAQWASDHHYQLKSINEKWQQGTVLMNHLSGFMAFLSHDTTYNPLYIKVGHKCHRSFWQL